MIDFCTKIFTSIESLYLIVILLGIHAVESRVCCNSDVMSESVCNSENSVLTYQTLVHDVKYDLLYYYSIRKHYSLITCCNTAS
jgi:hypothetical protein